LPTRDSIGDRSGSDLVGVAFLANAVMQSHALALLSNVGEFVRDKAARRMGRQPQFTAGRIRVCAECVKRRGGRQPLVCAHARQIEPWHQRLNFVSERHRPSRASDPISGDLVDSGRVLGGERFAPLMIALKRALFCCYARMHPYPAKIVAEAWLHVLPYGTPSRSLFVDIPRLINRKFGLPTKSLLFAALLAHPRQTSCATAGTLALQQP
jgi:hypothetical protein